MIEQLDLSTEIITHFASVKDIFQDAIDGADTTTSQKASAAKVINELLSQLTRMQAEIFNIDRVRAMENALIESLASLPETTKEDFFRVYEEKLALL